MNFWHWLLRRARIHPILTGLSIFIVLSVGGLLLGWVVALYEAELEVWLSRIEKASNVIGWFAVMAAYALALLAWAHRKEAAISFFGTGQEVDKIKNAFDASLILVSRHSQTEWHLRHIQPERVELVWTPMVMEQTESLLKRLPQIQCLDSRHRSLSNEEAYDISGVKRHCIGLLMGILNKYDKDQVCVDLTAGTAIMTLAAFQAAEELGVTSIYLIGKTPTNGRGYVIDDKKVHEPNEAKVVIVSDHRRIG
ncbi:MAG: hypothetical protein ABFS56_18670 [Pseudomonadota bacterium]